MIKIFANSVVLLIEMALAVLGVVAWVQYDKLWMRIGAFMLIVVALLLFFVTVGFLTYPGCSWDGGLTFNCALQP